MTNLLCARIRWCADFFIICTLNLVYLYYFMYPVCVQGFIVIENVISCGFLYIWWENSCYFIFKWHLTFFSFLSWHSFATWCDTIFSPVVAFVCSLLQQIFVVAFCDIHLPHIMTVLWLLLWQSFDSCYDTHLFPIVAVLGLLQNLLPPKK